MVAQTILLPNIRKLFIPDPGYAIAEADLAGAEARVVAWDANDASLKDAFKHGLNVHVKNARDVFPARVKGWSDEAIKATDHPGGVYYICKRCVHATHNGGKPAGLAWQIGISVREATNFQNLWFEIHPAIPARFEYIEDCLRGNIEGVPKRTIYNKFGYRMVYFDRIEEIFTKALTWIQQSSIGIVCFRGATMMYEQTPWVKLLLQVHDSVVFQYPMAMHDQLWQVHDALHSVVIPYDDPLCVPWELKVSTKSWGDCESLPWAKSPA